MTARFFWIIIIFPFLSLYGAEIVLIYPRLEYADSVFEYDWGLDSTFVLGHVTPPIGKLHINGYHIELTPQGAFLAWLPIEKKPDALEWSLSFTAYNSDSAHVRFPYNFKTAQARSDSFENPVFPRVLKITATNAHIRTAPDGSYFLFPQIGCRILATGYHNDFIRVSLGGELTGYIDKCFVEMESDSQLDATKLSDGYWTRKNRKVKGTFGISSIVPWSAELIEDGNVLQIMLYHTIAAVNRVRFELNDPLIHEITWAQRSEGVVLRVAGKQPFSSGFQIVFENDSLNIYLHERNRSGKKLTGKSIVIDPGHGGKVSGAIGPLGTREKDVALQLSLLLANELRSSDAYVVLTREDDRDLGLYDRIEIARRANADYYISVHMNALPDGENPFTRHGSSTYYYQTQSRSAAALIHRHLLEAGGLADDGLWYANLAAVRPTDFPAVLIEAAYLIYPPEEQLLQSNRFLRRLAKGLARGIGDYFEIH